jgi:hypothetical protein
MFLLKTNSTYSMVVATKNTLKLWMLINELDICSIELLKKNQINF